MNWLMDWIREGRDLDRQSLETRNRIAELLEDLKSQETGYAAYQRGRREAMREVAAECALESENPRYMVVQMPKDTYLSLMNALGDPS